MQKRVKLRSLSKYVLRCAIWYHLHNFLKKVKNNHGGVLLLINLQAKYHGTF